MLSPAGLVLAIVALMRGERQSDAGRICAWIALGISGLGTLVCGCQTFLSMRGSFG